MMLKKLERCLRRFLLLMVMAIFVAPCALAWNRYELVGTDVAGNPLSIPMEWSGAGWNALIPENSRYSIFRIQVSTDAESATYGWVATYTLNRGWMGEPLLYGGPDEESEYFVLDLPERCVFIVRTEGDIPDGAPRGFEFYIANPISYYINYQLDAGNDMSWAMSQPLAGPNESELTLTTMLTNGAHFGLKNQNNQFYGPQGETGTVRPGSICTDFRLNDTQFIWGGADGEVTLKVKIGKYGEPESISFEGTELDYDLPAGVPVDGVHMYGSWDNGEPMLIGTFVNGKFSISNPSSSTRTLRYIIYDSGKAYGHPGSDFSQNLAGFEYMNAVDAQQAAEEQSLGYFVAVIPASSSLDVCYEDGFIFNTGNNHGEFRYEPRRAGRGVWFTNLEFLHKTVAGMPFYPAGVSGENAFTALDADKKFYYLRGHSINNNFLSPEWQLLESDTPGVYTIDFTYNYHTDTKSCPVAVEERHVVDVVSFTKEQSEPDFCTRAEVPEPRDNNYWYAGMRVRATYDEATGALTITPIRLENGRWKECEVFEADYLPFISLVGAEWNQESEAPIANEDMEGKGTTSLGWQNAWIQYDADTNPVVGRDGVSVYYNTQWPPLNPVYFNSRFTDATGSEHNLTLSSEQLTFVTDGEIQSGADWQKDSRYNFADVSFSNGDANNPIDLSERNFMLYTVEDMWVNGKFKIWSGWNGDHLDVHNDEGLLVADDAEWHSNWNWGYVEENRSVTTPTPAPYYYGARIINVGETAPLSNRLGDMVFPQPTYVRSVYFFLDVDNPNDKGFSRIYTRNAIGGAQIQASDRVGIYDCGLMQPKMTALENLKVTSVSISAFRDGDKTQTLIPVYSAEGFSKNANEFAAMFADCLSEGDGALDPSGFWMDGVAYEAPGKYRYTMTVTFSDGSHETVRSNPFYVKGKSSGLYAYQLVQTPEGDRITYSTASPKAYRVEGRGDSLRVYPCDPLTDEQLSASDYLWTSQVLLYVEDNQDATRVEENWTCAGDSFTHIEGEYAALVVEASALREDYDATYTYRVDAGTGSTDFTESLPATCILLVPTPRLLSDLSVEVTTDDDASTFTVTGDDHFGDLAQEDYTAEQVEYTARQRHLNVRVPLEKSNATDALLALIGDATPTAVFTGSLSDQLAGEIALNFAADRQVLLADQAVRSWISGQPTRKINCNPNPTADMSWEELQQQWWYNDMSMWFKNITEYDAVTQTLGLDINAGGLYLYNRASDPVKLEMKQPVGIDPGASNMLKSMYVTNVMPDPDVNLWVQRLVLRDYAFDSYALPGSFTFNAEDADSKVEEEWKTYDGVKRYKMEPTKDDNGNFVIDPATGMTVQKLVEYYEDGYRSIDYDAHLGLKFNGEHFGISGADGKSETNHAHRYERLTHADAALVVIDRELGTWWSGIDQMLLFTDDDALSLSHTFFFKNAPYGVVEGDAATQRVAGKAPRSVEAKVEAFFPGYASVNLYSYGLQTGVETVTTSGASIISGEGFIDLMGNEGGVFGVDGTVLYLGCGRVELPAGIYVVKTASDSAKVIVK